MKKVKIFVGSAEIIENAINDWLKESYEIGTILQMTQSETSCEDNGKYYHIRTISILYEVISLNDETKASAENLKESSK